MAYPNILFSLIMLIHHVQECYATGWTFKVWNIIVMVRMNGTDVRLDVMTSQWNPHRKWWRHTQIKLADWPEGKRRSKSALMMRWTAAANQPQRWPQSLRYKTFVGGTAPSSNSRRSSLAHSSDYFNRFPQQATSTDVFDRFCFSLSTQSYATLMCSFQQYRVCLVIGLFSAAIVT